MWDILSSVNVTYLMIRTDTALEASVFHGHLAYKTDFQRLA
jgi:hypothetical protein